MPILNEPLPSSSINVRSPQYMSRWNALSSMPLDPTTTISRFFNGSKDANTEAESNV